MEIEIGRGKKARQAYGFDDIAIVPSRRTRDPQDVDIGWKLGPHLLELPLLASAMDGVVSPEVAIKLGELGGLGVLNLEGIFTRYPKPERELEKIARLPKEQATRGMQEIYARPVEPKLLCAAASSNPLEPIACTNAVRSATIANGVPRSPPTAPSSDAKAKVRSPASFRARFLAPLPVSWSSSASRKHWTAWASSFVLARRSGSNHIIFGDCVMGV